MKRHSYLKRAARLLVLLSLVLSSLAVAGADGAIPVTSNQTFIIPAESSDFVPDIRHFIAAVINGQSGVPAGVYIPGVLALKIVQQPKDNPAFVSTSPNILTQFQLASGYFTVGLLAHNFLAGSQFFKIHKNQIITLVLGDGSLKDYKVNDIQSFQALSPNNPYSNFLSPDGSKTLTSEDVFNQIYARGNQLVFQTCIQKGKEESWGRLFVIADEIDNSQAENYFIPADYLPATHFIRAVVGTD